MVLSLIIVAIVPLPETIYYIHNRLYLGVPVSELIGSDF